MRLENNSTNSYSGFQRYIHKLVDLRRKNSKASSGQWPTCGDVGHDVRCPNLGDEEGDVDGTETSSQRKIGESKVPYMYQMVSGREQK